MIIKFKNSFCDYLVGNLTLAEIDSFSFTKQIAMMGRMT